MLDLIRCKRAIEYFANKENYKHMRVFQVILQKWSIIEEAAKILEMISRTTKALQQKSFTLSDFCGYLIVLKQNLIDYIQKTNSCFDLAQCLLQELEKRLPQLMTNPMMLCAVYLDRRISTELSERETELAKITLTRVWRQIQENIIIDESIEGDNQVDNEKDYQFPDNNSVLEKYFNDKGLVAENQNETDDEKTEPDYKMKTDQLLLVFDKFEKSFGRLHATTPILEFWEAQKEKFPEMYILSTVVNAIAPSQSRTERDFSVLGFVYSDRRHNLKLSTLESILLLKLNTDLTLDIFAEDRNKLSSEE